MSLEFVGRTYEENYPLSIGKNHILEIIEIIHEGYETVVYTPPP